MATTSTDLARLAALLADETRAEILCALMDGRAHTGSELSRHVGVAPSTISEHLGKLLDGELVTVRAQGRHRYWQLTDSRIAELLESLGAAASTVEDPRAPSDLTFTRTCYDHLAGALAVHIFDRLRADGCFEGSDDEVALTPAGFDRLAALGVDPDAIRSATRTKARACLDWTQRRHHLAGAAGAELLTTFTEQRWIVAGLRPRSMRLTETGREEIGRAFGLPPM